MFNLKESMTNLAVSECQQELDVLNRKIQIIEAIKQHIITSLNIDESHQFSVELKNGAKTQLKLSYDYDGDDDCFDESLAYYHLFSVDDMFKDCRWDETGSNRRTEDWDIVKVYE